MWLDDFPLTGGIVKSYENPAMGLSDHLELLQAVYEDACRTCTAVSSDLRDLMTIRARVKDEGVSFLTITLPEFARGVERCLELGYVDSSYFRSFAKHGAIPAFLQGMISRLFDRETGRIYEPSSETPILVQAVRQVCLFYKKVALPCTPTRERAAVENFVKVEQDNKDFDLEVCTRASFARVARVLWDGMLGRLRLDMLLPRHGPGAVAERLLGNQKYDWRFWSERLEPFFPFVGTAFTEAVSADEEWRVEKVTFQPADQETPVRVITVPKTLKSPRVIAIEPAHMQYVQQALKTWLYAAIESWELTRGHVNFRDQTVNQMLAIASSKNGWGATIDLSDASDRVLNELVKEIFQSYPDVSDAVQACRSTRAQLPDGTLVGPLVKFASMGSALCFPIEAMVFYTACVAALVERHGLPVTRKSVLQASRGVFVYGDDIIVPRDDADAVLDYLRRINCKVNSSKTFTGGNFRESCGTDAFNGAEVTPTYLRTLRPQNRQQASELISWVATANAFFQKGYTVTASLMFRTCERILGELPSVTVDAGCLGRVDGLTGPQRQLYRWNPDLQRVEIRAWVGEDVERSDSLDGHPALTKSLLGLEARAKRVAGADWDFAGRHVGLRELPLESSPDHLEKSVRHGAVTLKRRWVPAT